MGKIGFLFSGQGVQSVGMGKNVYDNVAQSKEVFDCANKLLGWDIANLCFEGKREMLNQTRFTQPALFTTSVAILEAIKVKGITPDVVAGFSLGEYAALVASGAMAFEDALRLVDTRGRLMDEAVPQGQGTMAAIIGLSRKEVEVVCKESSFLGIVEVANDNCPGQLVISGDTKAVLYACEVAKEKGARRAIELNVSGPFHSSLLEKVAKHLSEEVKKLEFNQLKVPLVSNVTADYVKANQLPELLALQVKSGVRFRESIERMIEDQVDTFVEIGVGRTLCSFVRKINRQVTTYNVENIESLEKLCKALGVGAC